MNTRLSLNLICNFPLNKQRGFALPLALMSGMVVLVVAATMIIRAQGDQSKVVSKIATDQATAAAEAGATQYVDFLNRNRGLIAYTPCAGTVTNGVCPDTGSTMSWSNPSAVFVTVAAVPSDTNTASAAIAPGWVDSLTSLFMTQPANAQVNDTCTTSSTGTATYNPPAGYKTDTNTVIASEAKGTNNKMYDWKNLDGGGQYRLVQYVPKGAVTDANGRVTTITGAEMVVEGKDPNGKGVSRIAVTIPTAAVVIPTSGGGGGGNSGSGVPGLFARNFKTMSGNEYTSVWKATANIAGDGYGSTSGGAQDYSGCPGKHPPIH